MRKLLNCLIFVVLSIIVVWFVVKLPFGIYSGLSGEERKVARTFFKTYVKTGKVSDEQRQDMIDIGPRAIPILEKALEKRCESKQGIISYGVSPITEILFVIGTEEANRTLSQSYVPSNGFFLNLNH